MNKAFLYFGTVIILLLGALIAFSNKGEVDQGKIVTSIAPIASIVESITGSEFEVIQLLPSGASPHSFEPSARDKEMISDAGTAFIVGLELDHWAESLLEDQPTKVIDLSDNVIIDEEHEEEENHDDDDDDEHDHTGANPHYWLSTQNAELIASMVLEELINLKPESEEKFRENYASFQIDLDEIRIYGREKLHDISEKRAITFHDAFGYFAEEFEIEILTSIEPFPGKEPTAAYLNEVQETIDEYGVRVLFKEPQLSNSSLAALAEDNNATIHTIDPLGGIEGRESYTEMMRFNIDTFAAAFQN